MVQLVTIARPYATAVFANAKEAGKLPQWSQELANLSMIAQDTDMQSMIANPSMSEEQIIDIFASIMKDGLSAEGKNLLTVMSENKRLASLPDVCEMFDELMSEDSKRIKATVISAHEVTAKQLNKLNTALNTKFDAEVEITVEIDASLISGIKIIVGDWAVDGSAQAQLNKLGAVIAQ